MLSTCKNIQSLFLDCTFYRYTTPDDLANTFYRTAHVFLEALCDAKGDIDDAVDVIRLAEWNYNRTRVKADKESTTVEGSTEDGSAKEGSAKEGSAKAGSAKYRPAENVEQEFNQALSDLLQARCRRR
ncbi:hypothetical protein TI39_contig4112g00006 [Zymoseptoria brevis]|uniref:Uncharacterized protein n=1 Tax=Zymoseptoria brevis TaxID=1047168 RepID=A0A0F4GDS2_9PEZI|nr:hypothetical protein TI39_contig4112g00006 [Zymoseptoria brevis]